jgi:hypothetical protein
MLPLRRKQREESFLQLAGRKIFFDIHFSGWPAVRRSKGAKIAFYT